MILKNAKTLDKDFNPCVSDIRIEGERITEIGNNLTGGDAIDMTGKYVLPGFIDTHIHGAFGVRVSDGDADLEKITSFEATRGVTSLALTTAASEFDGLLGQLTRIRDASGRAKGAKIAAIHAEGPFISHKYKGAMTEKYILTPKRDTLDKMLEASGGMLKILTIAPEVEGSLDVIKYAVSNGVAVSMGHTDADYDTAMRAIEAGATRMTHTFNAARPINHREPGVLAAALTCDSVTCEMICDLVHLHFATIKMIYALKGADRINMISDSGHAAGLDVSEFEVDGVIRYVKDGVVRLANGTIAGSAMTLHDGVRNLIKGGIPIGDVAKMASLIPARELGIEKDTGSIEAGKLADLAVLDGDFNVVKTFVNGREI
ncbi:MAG: N-acetylglucosamine-6-phosphate deacetylase [Ruminococcaceae bacterium]|nr:N-acetylglucosamine-6-phosphate deacetylase [Oscillospiraceae bacterium]